MTAQMCWDGLNVCVYGSRMLCLPGCCGWLPRSTARTADADAFIGLNPDSVLAQRRMATEFEREVHACAPPRHACGVPCNTPLSVASESRELKDTPSILLVVRSEHAEALQGRQGLQQRLTSGILVAWSGP